MDEDQLYVITSAHAPPRRGVETVSGEWLAEQLEQIPRKWDVRRAALLGTLTGAAIVIAWIEVVHRVCL
jgi:hypothetical protein